MRAHVVTGTLAIKATGSQMSTYICLSQIFSCYLIELFLTVFSFSSAGSHSAAVCNIDAEGQRIFKQAEHGA